LVESPPPPCDITKTKVIKEKKINLTFYLLILGKKYYKQEKRSVIFTGKKRFPVTSLFYNTNKI